MQKTGKVILIPNHLGSDRINHVITDEIVQVIASLEYLIVENIRTVRRYMSKLGLTDQIDKTTFYVLDKRTKYAEISDFLEPVLSGNNIGIISEAGCPGVADPGAQVVQIAHERNIKVEPMVGPSSIILALMGSGMNGQNFAFRGYLPVKKGEKLKELKRLENISRSENQTQIFIETPYRNNSMMQDLIESLNPMSSLCVACDLTLPTEFIATKKIKEWKKSIPELNKRPTVFLFIGN